MSDTVKTLLLFALTTACAVAGPAPDSDALRMLQAVQQSHIEGNIPPPDEFDGIMSRDLLAYFRSSQPKATRVEYELLRNVPTQSGVAYPKYYAWVKAITGGKVLVEGAVRMAAVDREHFEVLEFMSKQTIRVDRSSVSSVFPAALVAGIVARADSQ